MAARYSSLPGGTDGRTVSSATSVGPTGAAASLVAVPVPGLPEVDQSHVGTMVQSTKLPLTVWFQAMHLLTQGKDSISALELMRQLGVHYGTAWAFKHKLMQVMLAAE